MSTPFRRLIGLTPAILLSSYTLCYVAGPHLVAALLMMGLLFTCVGIIAREVRVLPVDQK